MNTGIAPAPGERSTLGYSQGRWEGETLVVDTSLLIPERFDDHGTPFSESLTLTERFSLREGGHRLDYVLTAMDPESFPEPVEMRRHWDWRPEIVVGAYHCEQDQELR